LRKSVGKPRHNSSRFISKFAPAITASMSLLVDLHQHDQVLWQIVDAGYERVLVVVGETR
jgi:hypothetical protein